MVKLGVEILAVVKDCPTLSKMKDSGHYVLRAMEDHPNLDLVQQFRNMRSWLDANPRRRPKMSPGVKQFCTRWLNRNDRGIKNRQNRRDDY